MLQNKLKVIGLVTILTIAFLPLFAQAQSTFKLSCSAEGDAYIFNVDINSSSVNGRHVDITEEAIYWSEAPGGYGAAIHSYYINRYTGWFRTRVSAGTGHESEKVGQCQKVSEKQF